MHRSLQKAFWTFGGVLVLAYALLSAQISNWQEDQLLLRQISLEFESYLLRHPEVLTGSPPPPLTSRFFSVHLGESSLPHDLRRRASELPSGIHEISRSPREGEDYFLAVRGIDKGSERLYLLYDVRRFDDIMWWHSKAPVLLVACGVVFSIGLIWASRYSRAVLEPLTGLAELVAQESRPAGLAEVLSRRNDPAELAHLSRALQGSMQTIDELIHRERMFTRNASHELRTPLSVIRGSVELLKYEDLSGPAAERLLRIERSVEKMEELIETFLWLARRHPEKTEERVAVRPLVLRVIKSHRHLLGSRPVDVVVAMDRDLEVAAHEAVLAVVLSNVVKNAFYSTREGSVTFTDSKDSLSVVDTGPGLGSVDAGYGQEASTHGLGLTIVRDLCRRSRWRLELRDYAPRGTEVIVRFS
ncbi:MAG: HAMP domain-containing sensor histidine kinase [Acidobacteriota bacterium]